MNRIISFDISSKFLFPEFCIINWHGTAFTTFMTMPKTTVNKNNCFIFGKNNIRMTGQVFTMEAKAKTVFMKKSPDNKFRFGVLIMHHTHVS